MSSLFERFEQNAARHPGKAAFIYFESGTWKTLTYRQMLNATQKFSAALHVWDVKPGMCAALLTPPGADFFPLALALLKLNILPVIVDPAIGLKKLAACINESQPEIFIGNPLTNILQNLFGWGKESVKIKLTIEKLLNNAQENLPNPDTRTLSPDSPAAIIYTSGSTGVPKGVLYTQENLSAQLDMLADTFHITPDEMDIPAFPLYALIDVLLGVTAVIPDITFPVPKDINPALTLSAIQKFHVTNTFASPVVLDKLAEYGNKRDIKLPSLKRVITAGAPAPAHLQRRFRNLLADETSLFGIYGATEALPMAMIESREIFQETQSKTANGAGICLGKPVDGMEVRIIQISEKAIPNFQDVETQPVNRIGEIAVKGKPVTKKYISREEANRLSKIQDGESFFHRTGDVGFFDEQGRLWYCGRKSHRVITQDGVLFTEQIEGIFNAHPLVYRTALVGVDGKPVLWIELEKNIRYENREKIKKELLGLSANHPQASKIKRFLFAKKFPTDARHNSKIIREELALRARKKIKNSSA